MLWFVVLFYLALSPVACLLIGRAIRERNVERPSESCEPTVDAATVPVAS